MIGKKIRLGRIKLGLSQDELAKFLGVHKQSISRWESNKSIPEGDMLIKIAKKLNISKELLEDDEEEAKNPENNTITSDALDRFKKEVMQEVRDELNIFKTEIGTKLDAKKQIVVQTQNNNKNVKNKINQEVSV